MASLANQTISSTYDGLIKTSTDQPVGVSGVQLLEDGVGNTLALSVGRANQGVTVTGTLTATAFSGDLTGDVTGDLTGNVTGNLTGNVTGDVTGDLTGTVLTAAQTNITSVGTLSSLAVSGNLTVDTNTLFVDSTNNRVIVGSNTSAFDLSVIKSSDVSVVAQSTSASQAAYLSSYNSDTTNAIQVRSYGGSVSGTIFGNSIGGANAVWSNGDNKFLIGTIGSTPVIFGTANTEHMRIDSSGNVGIGTTSPDSVFHIRNDGSGGVGANLILETAHPSGIPLLDLKGAASSQIRYKDETDTIQTRIDMRDGGEVVFINAAGSAERMRIDSSGNVGIGTSSPSAKLQIGDGSSDAYQTIDSLYGGAMLFKKAGTNSAFVGETEQGLGSGDGLLLYTYGGDRPIRFYTNGANERMRIDSSGNVGIGTSSPAFAVDVVGSANSQLRLDTSDAADTTLIMDYNGGGATGRVRIRNANGALAFNTANSSERMRIALDGFVYINDVAGRANLNVRGTYASGRYFNQLHCLPSNGDAEGGLYIGSISANNSIIANGNYYNSAGGHIPRAAEASIIALNADGITFSTDSGLTDGVGYIPTARMRIDNLGQLGIGTTSPAHRLDVSGTTRSGRYITEEINIAVPHNTWTTFKTFALGDQNMGIVTSRYAGTNATTTANYAKTYDGGTSQVHLVNLAQINSVQMRVSGDSLQVYQPYGVTLSCSIRILRYL